MKKKILICGATGFIGRNFINRFKLNDKYKIIAVYNKKNQFYKIMFLGLKLI